MRFPSRLKRVQILPPVQKTNVSGLGFSPNGFNVMTSSKFTWQWVRATSGRVEGWREKQSKLQQSHQLATRGLGSSPGRRQALMGTTARL